MNSNRLRLTLSKLAFCYDASVDLPTFIRLLGNTKRLAFSSQQQYECGDVPSIYNLKLNGVQLQIFLRTYAGDLAILYEVFWHRAYQRFPIDYSKFKTIIDVGANIGMASLSFYTLSPKAKILAIEPDLQNFELLQLNVSNSVCAEHITAINVAISNLDEELYLETKRFAYNSAVNKIPQGMAVRSISLNTCLQQHHLTKIDLIKIDVEGFEHQIFSSDLEWLEKVDNVLIEIHSEKDYTACIKKLMQKGFTVKSALPKSLDQENIYWAHRN